MKAAGDHQRLGNTEPAWNGVQPFLTVIIRVLASIDHVEACCPTSDRQVEDQGDKIDLAGNGHPAA
ncbi:hypothetical protein D3C71_2006270 [compost metagenome]